MVAVAPILNRIIMSQEEVTIIQVSQAIHQTGQIIVEDQVVIQDIIIVITDQVVEK